MADKDYNVLIDVKDPSVWKKDPYAVLLENLGVDIHNLNNDTDCFFIQEAGRQVDATEQFYFSEAVFRTGQGVFQAAFDCI